MLYYLESGNMCNTLHLEEGFMRGGRLGTPQVAAHRKGAAFRLGLVMIAFVILSVMAVAFAVLHKPAGARLPARTVQPPAPARSGMAAATTPTSSPGGTSEEAVIIRMQRQIAAMRQQVEEERGYAAAQQ